MAAHFARDPFARTVLHRESARDAAGRYPLCAWCGGPYAGDALGYATRGYRPTYRYAAESDAAPCRALSGRAFCGVDCWRAYTA